MPKIRADFHNHGPQGMIDKGTWSAERLVEIAKVRGLDILGVVEMRPGDDRFEISKNNCPEGYEVDTNQIYVPEQGIVLSRVLEVPTYKEINSDWTKNRYPEGHVLIVNAKKRIKEGPLEKVLEEAYKQSACVIADHPYAGGHDASIGILRANSEEKIKGYIRQGLIHGIEYNGQIDSLGLLRIFTGWRANKKAIQFAKENDLPLIASTDAHSLRENKRKGAHTEFDLDHSTPPGNYVRECTKLIMNNQKQKIHPECRPAPAFAQEIHAYRILVKPKMDKLTQSLRI